jgi:hypothetical protein
MAPSKKEKKTTSCGCIPSLLNRIKHPTLIIGPKAKAKHFLLTKLCLILNN